MSYNYRLIYFNLRSRGEPIRLALHFAGVPFKDVRVPFKEWPSLKPKTPHGTLPILESDGWQLSESNSILRYIARRYGLEGVNEAQIAELDSLNEVIADINNKCIPYWIIVAGIRRENSEVTKRLRQESIATINAKLPVLERSLGTARFLAGSERVNYVDFALASLSETLERLAGDELKRFEPALTAHRQRVYELPRVAEYLATRQDTY